ncbi:glycine betaine ABC transporter substrate-binding protein [Cupriavidus plantarum]|uniref:glycine betaine ABC transporter substrate-binding protein n=1 Tax=Cupriavidus plantarum TaxID=942865 RepID=UPI0038B31B6B
MRRLALLLVAALIGRSMHGAMAQSADSGTLRIGSKRFTESYILGEVLVQTARTQGDARHLPGLGNTAIVFEALKAGSIDLYPDYTGTLANELLRLPPGLPAGGELDAINAALAPMGLGAAILFGFQNTYAIAVSDKTDTAGTAIRSLSDLAGQPRLRLGLSHEFLGRADGWPGLAQRYRLLQQPIGLDHGVAYEALAQGQVDAIDIYSTDAKIHKYKLRVLTDPLHYFPPYDALVVYRLDVPRRYPAMWRALEGLAGRIHADQMIDMNAAAEIDGESFAAVARDFLAARIGRIDKTPGARGESAPPVGELPRVGELRGDLARTLFSADTWRLTQRHLALVFGAVGAAIAIGVPLGIVADRRRRLGQGVLALVSVLQTIPSLALLAILIPLLGRIGVWPAMVALFLYALLPIVRNTHTGLGQVSPGMRAAASALGFRALQVLRYVELPLAMPVILAGVKTAAVISVGTATIAAFVGAGGYGERIATGLALNDHVQLLAGAVPAAVMALVIEWGFSAFEARRQRRMARQ